MSAIVISAAVSLIEWDQILFLIRLRVRYTDLSQALTANLQAWQEIGLAVFTFTLTYVLGVDLGILLRCAR
jgi:hypothetical protein